MSYGVIFTGFGTKEYIHQSLAPWIALRRAAHREDSIFICAVSVKFAGFEGEDDGTREILREYLVRGEIDHLIDGPDNIPETTARGMALNYLLGKPVKTIVQWDSDEVPTDEAELRRIMKFVDAQLFTTWFRLSYANLVFDENTRLVDPFTPPRIHRVWSSSYRVHSFSGDNDIQYGGTITRDIIPQERFPSATIPEFVALPRHFSWLNDERSRKKVAYQKRRWGHCSFDWDDSKGGLIFNPSLPAPKVSQIKP